MPAIGVKFFPDSVLDMPYDKDKKPRRLGYFMWFVIWMMISVVTSQVIIEPRILNEIYTIEKTVQPLYPLNNSGDIYVIDLTLDGKPGAGYFVKTEDNFTKRIIDPKFSFNASKPCLITTTYYPKPGIKSYLWTYPKKYTKYIIQLKSRESIVSR